MGIIVTSQQRLPISARLSKSQDDLRRLCCTSKKKVKITKRGLVGDGEFHPCPNSISSATKSKLSDNHASHSSGNGYLAIPVNKQCNKHNIIPMRAKGVGEFIKIRHKKFFLVRLDKKVCPKF